ncbi:MAG: thiamine pyrophosphate-dependent dehydrogenase E1 component subunit alpha [Deltaproteobacteria bacterium]|nr:thiamine pyrophosphate-dependent dehydrogenase E1 component subunit alpha [Deltaproteobacteria bacterium]
MREKGDVMSPWSLQVPEKKISQHDACAMYTLLLRTRLFEDEIYYICANQTPQHPFIVGKGYLSTGQEAISVGCAYALAPDDWFAQSHRDMAAHFHRGLTFVEALYQYRCTTSSPTHGRDGNVHFAKEGTHMVGFTSHMGQNVAVALGLAWAQRYRKTDRVALATFGEGAAQQGIIHESMNYAATFQLPMIFVINNNRWAISVPVQEQTSIEDLAIRGAAYHIPATVVDGNDTVAVYRAATAAVALARAGRGPSLIECKTMRVMGHGTHDPATYVPADEKTAWRARDPVVLLKRVLCERGWWSDERDTALRAEIRAELDTAVDVAGNDPPPDPRMAVQDVFSTPVPVE